MVAVQGIFWELMTSWEKLMVEESAKGYLLQSAMNFQKCPFVISLLVLKHKKEEKSLAFIMFL